MASRSCSLALQVASRVLLAMLCSLVIVGTAAAASITGHVVSIADGDTLTILDAEHRQHIIRLDGIDAPEKGKRLAYAGAEGEAKDARLGLWSVPDAVAPWDWRRGAVARAID